MSTSELVNRLRATAQQLQNNARALRFGGDECHVRVKSPDLLLADLNDAVSLLEHLEAERQSQDKALSEAEAANVRLRQVVVDSAAAIGNGAGLSPESSLDFIEILPSEIAAYTNKLRRFLKCSRDEGTEALDRALAAEARLAEFKAEARKVIEPFALVPLAYTDDIDDSATVFEYEGGAITLGDLRRVHALNAQEKS